MADETATLDTIAVDENKTAKAKDDTTALATFRIDKAKWEAFRTKSGNASKTLIEFIDNYLAGDYVPSASPSRFIPNNIDDRLDKLESRMKYLENLEKRLEALEGDLGKSESLKADNDALRLTITNLESEIETSRHSIANLENELEQSRQRNSSLESEIDEYRQTIQRLETELEQSRLSISLPIAEDAIAIEEIVEPEQILSNIPGIAPNEVVTVSKDNTFKHQPQHLDEAFKSTLEHFKKEAKPKAVDTHKVSNSDYKSLEAVGQQLIEGMKSNAIAPLPQPTAPESVEEPEQPEVVQAVPSDDVATIPDDSEKVDAGEFDAATADDVGTEQPEAVEAIAIQSTPLRDVPPGTAFERKQMAEHFSEVGNAQTFTDWANPKKYKNGAEILAQRGFEVVKVNKQNSFRRLSDTELKALGYEPTEPENGTPRYKKVAK